ncbi:hypothetical protein [Bacillus thuringiensis]|uniref:hypothetical protein n=1 Tax=Bacillus thuringiensis TaxID=1428 RepID=UPI00159BC3F0
MIEQITLLPVMDKEMKKRLQQEVVSILKEYRTLKARFNNGVAPTKREFRTLRNF